MILIEAVEFAVLEWITMDGTINTINNGRHTTISASVKIIEVPPV